MPSVECIHRSSLRSPHVFVALFRYVWRTGGKGALFRNASGRFLRGWFLQYSMGIRYEGSQKIFQNAIPWCRTGALNPLRMVNGNLCLECFLCRSRHLRRLVDTELCYGIIAAPRSTDGFLMGFWLEETVVTLPQNHPKPGGFK